MVLSPTASSVAVDTKGEIGCRVFRGRPSEALRAGRTGLGLRDFGEEETGSVELGPVHSFLSRTYLVGRGNRWRVVHGVLFVSFLSLLPFQ